MGSYLTQPITEKNSSDGANEFIKFGSSCMQGWRVTQEDAHNCCADFGENTSFFAVYDGHGGAEVSLYCSQKLPDFLKSIEAYQSGDYEKALKDAFIGFDSTLIDPAVVEELKKLIVNSDGGSETEDDADDEDLVELCKEGRMDLNDVLEKYKDGTKNPVHKLLSEANVKPISPYLRGRRNGTSECSDGASSSGSSSTCIRKSIESENAVSSTSKQKFSDGDDNEPSASPSGSGLVKSSQPLDGSTKNENKTIDVNCSPVSSSTSKSEPNYNVQITNGSHSKTLSEESEISTNSVKVEKVSSSSGIQNNGEISSNSLEDDDSSSEDDDVEYNECDNDDDDDDDDEEDDDEDDDEDEENNEDDEDMFPEDEEDDNGFISNMIEGPGQSSGCTAVVALLVGRELFVANAGDSRCVLCRNGETIEMSLDHKPEDDEESRRIINAGGRVTMDGRVNGGLNLSRAIGDHAYKMNKDLKPEEQMISAMPDVKKITIDETDEFMILACDGIWNFMSSEEVVEFVRKRLAENNEHISSICEELFTNCLATNTMGDGTGCDNMTAIIVQFKQHLSNTDNVSNARKRAASPVPVTELEHHKRLKTENNDAEQMPLLSST